MSTTLNYKTLWEEVLLEIERQVSKANFKTWFKDTFINKYDDGVVIVGVPNTFVKDWLSKKFHKSILKILRDTTEEVRAVEYVASALVALTSRINISNCIKAFASNSG